MAMRSRPTATALCRLPTSKSASGIARQWATSQNLPPAWTRWACCSRWASRQTANSYSASAACAPVRHAGGRQIPVVVHDIDPADRVAVEAAENFSRKDFTPTEAVAIKRAREPR